MPSKATISGTTIKGKYKCAICRKHKYMNVFNIYRPEPSESEEAVELIGLCSERCLAIAERNL